MTTHDNVWDPELFQDEQYILNHQAKAIHDRIPFSAGLQTLLLVACAGLLSTTVPPLHLGLWLGLMIFVALSRLSYRNYIIQNDLIIKDPAHCLQAYTVGTTAAGFVLGLCAIWFEAPETSQITCLLIMTCGSICAFSIAASSGVARISISFSIALFTPLVTRLIFIGTPGSMLASLGIVLTLGYIIVVSKQTELLFINHLKSRLQAERLAQEVQQMNRELASANLDLNHQATHDSLTQLYNRAAFHHHLNICCQTHSHRPEALVIMTLDLDRFKAVNDTLGHASGDEVLRQVGERLYAVMQPYRAHIARLGGDEFGLICPLDHDRAKLKKLGDALIARLTEPYDTAQGEATIGASLGMKPFIAGDRTPEILLQQVDQALYRAKKRGGNNFEIGFPPRKPAVPAQA